MKPDEFDRAVAKGDLGPLYYLYGDEPYLLEKALKRLLDTVVPDFRDFNLNIFYGKECKGVEAADAAQTLPMFAERRAVVIKEADALSAAALETLAGYIQSPSPSTVLVLVGEKPDQRKKFILDFKKKGEMVEFKRPYEDQLIPFIRSEAALHGKKIAPDAANALVYMIGANLQELASQLEKVATFAGARDPLTLDDIKAVASDTRIDSVFDLADSLGRRNFPKALRALGKLLGDGEAPVYVLAMITRHFRQLWSVRELMDKKLPQAEIGKAAKINPYFLKGVMEQAKNFRVPELQGFFERFYETDLALKSSGGRPNLLLERLVMDICGVEREGRR